MGIEILNRTTKATQKYIAQSFYFESQNILSQFCCLSHRTHIIQFFQKAGHYCSCMKILCDLLTFHFCSSIDATCFTSQKLALTGSYLNCLYLSCLFRFITHEQLLCNGNSQNIPDLFIWTLDVLLKTYRQWIQINGSARCVVVQLEFYNCVFSDMTSAVSVCCRTCCT